MSNWMAIAAVTDTLRNLFTDGFNGFTVPGIGNVNVRITNQPPDKAHASDEDSQLNVFLYQATPNAAWRNQPVPGTIKPGEQGYPPLALDLYYLLTTYGSGNDSPEPISHYILGRAMNILHDHPLLGREEIRTALEDSHLHEQIERIRITPYPLSLEELSKLWTNFQTGYRISAAYQLTVVLIESTRSAKTAPPVLARNSAADETPVLGEIPVFPSLLALRPSAPEQLSAASGDQVTLQGRGLSGGTAQVRFTQPLLELSEIVAPDSVSASQVVVTLPPAIDNWPAGYASVAVLVEKGGRTQISNELPMAIAPVITITVVDPTPANVQLHIAITPALQPEQRGALLFGDREIAVPERDAPTSELDIGIPDVVPGTYVVRLRVDGVDSIPYERSGDPPRLQFADSQKVTIGP